MSKKDEIKVRDIVSVCIEGRELGTGLVVETRIAANRSAVVEFADGRRLRMNQIWMTVIHRPQD